MATAVPTTQAARAAQAPKSSSFSCELQLIEFKNKKYSYRRETAQRFV